MNDNLKPCPFCGQTEYLVVGTDIELDLYVENSVPGFYTVCCSAAENKGGCGASSGYYPTREEAIEKWNRREGKQ